MADWLLATSTLLGPYFGRNDCLQHQHYLVLLLVERSFATPAWHHKFSCLWGNVLFNNVELVELQNFWLVHLYIQMGQYYSFLWISFTFFFIFLTFLNEHACWHYFSLHYWINLVLCHCHGEIKKIFVSPFFIPILILLTHCTSNFIRDSCEHNVRKGYTGI